MNKREARFLFGALTETDNNNISRFGAAALAGGVPSSPFIAASQAEVDAAAVAKWLRDWADAIEGRGE